MLTADAPRSEIERWAAAPLPALMAEAARLRDLGHGNIVSYSRKVFIPLTRLCRDTCRYCTFVRGPRAVASAYLSPDEVLAIARAGAAAGCQEALFTLGDKPELKYQAARRALAALGHDTTIDYLAAMCALVLRETGLLPHVNPGVMSEADIAALRRVSVSQGLMLESVSPRLGRRGGPHHGSPDKEPAVRLATIEAAGRLNVPFTTGILIGIGETRAERIDSLLAIDALHRRHGHIQEIIVQNFRAKDDTGMARAPEPDADDMLWTVAMARIVFGPRHEHPGAAQSQPRPAGRSDRGRHQRLGRRLAGDARPRQSRSAVAAIERLRADTAAAGKCLTERLAIYPGYAREPERWLDPALHTPVLRAADADGFARGERMGAGLARQERAEPDSPRMRRRSRPPRSIGHRRRASAGRSAATRTRSSRCSRRAAREFDAVCAAADALRASVSGDTVSYVVNRNINYTNVCNYGCRFCAFSKGKLGDTLRGPAYDLDRDEIARRVREAWERGATEVCMQGGIHPRYTGATYLDILDAVKRAVPRHPCARLLAARSASRRDQPRTDDRRLSRPAARRGPRQPARHRGGNPRRRGARRALPGQALDRAMARHRRGGASARACAPPRPSCSATSTRPEHWARHLLHIRDLQERTGGFTEFVPLPFVHMEAPIYLKGRARKGPTFREAVLMHAVARLVLHPLIPNIQVSWVKLGPDGAAACLDAGANDLGGTLMNESISRAAGTEHGQEFAPERMDALIASLGRTPRQRTTLYTDVPAERRRAAYRARRSCSRWSSTSAPAARAPSRRVERHAAATEIEDRRARRHRQGRLRPGAALGACRPPRRDRLALARARAARPPPRSTPASAPSAPRAPTISPRPQRGEIVVLTVPYAAQLATLQEVRAALAGKILIDVTVPLVPPQVGRVQLPEGGSAVVEAQKMLGEGVRVVSAFQNVSAEHLNDARPRHRLRRAGVRRRPRGARAGHRAGAATPACARSTPDRWRTRWWRRR